MADQKASPVIATNRSSTNNMEEEKAAAVSISVRECEQLNAKNDGKVSEEVSNVRMKFPKDGKYGSKWNMVFLFCCVIAVSLDPSFFYIPLINEEGKCVRLDQKLKITTLVLRSVMDMTYVLHIVVQILSSFSAEMSGASKKLSDSSRGKLQMNRILLQLLWAVKSRRISWWYILIDILAVLPIPQVVFLYFFSEHRGSTSLNSRKLLAIFVLIQYLPRILQISLSYTELTKNNNPNEITATSSFKGVFNFFMYILMSHVLGAFWYLFSIDRKVACWENGCKSSSDKCSPDSLYCDHDLNINEEAKTYLDRTCPVNPSDPTLFDFGMFGDALQSGIVSSTGFLEKFFTCFGWGLRNLSSFGSNLKTSNFLWENVFAVFISITGLLLFIFLIGNLQTYLQLVATRLEERRRKMKTKELDIKLWIASNDINADLEKDIMKHARKKFQAKQDVDLKNLLSVLPTDPKKNIKKHLCLATITKVPSLEDMSKSFLDDVFIEFLAPVSYTERSYIIREGEPLDQLLLFTQGTVWTYTSKNDVRHSLGKGDFYGEELLYSALDSSSQSNFPISSKTLKSHTKVEAFALMASDLNKLINAYWWHFKKLPRSNSVDRWGPNAATTLQVAWRRHLEKKPVAGKATLSSSTHGISPGARSIDHEPEAREK